MEKVECPDVRAGQRLLTYTVPHASGVSKLKFENPGYASFQEIYETSGKQILRLYAREFTAERWEYSIEKVEE